jgi:glycosyltransferase involved in cell wall biosynthesis
MVDAAKIVGQVYPQFVLMVIGESETESEQGWLRRYAEARDALQWVRFLGWLPYDEGLVLARRCAIGVSPFPRGALFESASPTKAVEYLALSLPIVCNDQPDQERVVRESGAGVCVELTPEAFASGILQLLNDPERARAMGAAGRGWLSEHRSYRRLAAAVAEVLRSISRQQHHGHDSR